MRRVEKDIGNDDDDDRKQFGIMKSFENFNESKSNSLSFSWVLSLCFDPSGHFDHCAAFLLCFRCCTQTESHSHDSIIYKNLSFWLLRCCCVLQLLQFTPYFISFHSFADSLLCDVANSRQIHLCMPCIFSQSVVWFNIFVGLSEPDNIPPNSSTLFQYTNIYLCRK